MLCWVDNPDLNTSNRPSSHPSREPKRAPESWYGSIGFPGFDLLFSLFVFVVSLLCIIVSSVIYCFIVSDLLYLCFCCVRGVDVCAYLCVVSVFCWLSGDVCKNCLRICRMVFSESHRKHPESPREPQRAQESPRELLWIYWFS